MFKEIRQFSQPKSLNQLRWFSDIINFYRRFPPNSEAAFQSSAEGRPYWTETLFFFLFGIRITDLNSCTEEMVFRVPLQLSGQLLSLWSYPANYVESLRAHMHRLQAVPTPPTSNSIIILTELNLVPTLFFAKMPFVNLLRPFIMILQRTEKTFTIIQNGKESIASVDRVNTGYSDKLASKNITLVFPPDPQVKEAEILMPITRTGRHVRFPDRYQARTR
ncbi:hypothetical protein ACTXT7_004216 [Hymenolepis weldensis]